MEATGVKTGWNAGCRKVLLRGALWTSPVWGAVLLMTAGVAWPPFDGLLGGYENAYTALVLVFMTGSSLCLFPGYAFSAGNAGFADASRLALSAALPVAFSYFLFAFFAFFFAVGEKGPAWGGAFGLVGASGSLMAALAGAWARLVFKYLRDTVLNPYRPAPPPQK